MNDPRILRIGTRGSALALWQSRHVAERLGRLADAPAVELVEFQTAGDRDAETALSALPGMAFFTKEIERALLDGVIDLAVHSLKDLATVGPRGLTVAAVLERADARDVLISRTGADLANLPDGARVGTSSLRRRAMMARARPDLQLLNLRGNVPTRIGRLDDGSYDAIVLAAAGVARLGLADRVSAYLDPSVIVPAAGQGAVAVQTRVDDEETLAAVRQLDHLPTRRAITAERAFLRRAEGGCQVPVGALASIDDDHVVLAAMICSLDGRRAVQGQAKAEAGAGDALGRRLADELLAQGGEEILAAIRRPQEHHP